jgi:hypothetical protein
VQDLTIVAKHTIYSAVVGSRAYGLAGPASDTDRRGVYQTPTEAFWPLDKPPSHVEGPLPEQFSWEVERACTLALQANPTVWECLSSPLVEHVTDAGRALLDLRPAFLSRRAARTYGDYARDQLNKLISVRSRTGEVRWKQAMHMARLLRAGAHVLRTGEVLVDVSALRDELLAIRRGEMSWDDFQALAAALSADLDAAAAATRLPEEPDRAAVDRFLVALRGGGPPAGAPAPDLRVLNTLPYVPQLIEAKRADEHDALPPSLVAPATLAADVARLTAELEAARDASALPAAPSAGPALHDLLVRTRMSR